MIYRALVVDDEMPALRYIRNIIEKYAPSFAVVNTCASSESALEYIQGHPVDLLITDINMRGQNGIELSKKVHELRADIHIIIISGYAEFEYAQGAIQASVDEYILKPVSVSHLRQVLARMKKQLDNEFHTRISKALSLIARGLETDPDEMALLFGSSKFRFAFIRFGNLNLRLPETLNTAADALSSDEPYIILSGRDEEEQILIFPEERLETFMASISVYMSQHTNVSTWTVVYQSAIQPIEMLTDFIQQAIAQLQRQVSIGKHQMVTLNDRPKSIETFHLSTSELHQIAYFASSGKASSLKDYFLSLAGEWESMEITQIQAWAMIRQMIHYLARNISSLEERLDDALGDIQEHFLYASSYGELLMNTYSVLFNDNTFKDKKHSTRELYDYAIQFINENYAKPLSMQSVCEDIGISRTYLNRLFRKYSDSTFNVYLTHCRMEAAMQLLQDQPNILLRDVAACVGYEDSSYFSKVFHQYSGLTPSQYSMRRKS